MELINCVKSALESQCDIVVDYRNREFITDSLHWSRTIEGYLFWEILYTSYTYYGIYDYITIIYIYHRFGKDAFKCSTMYLESLYNNNFNGVTLDKDGLDEISNTIETYLIM